MRQEIISPKGENHMGAETFFTKATGTNAKGAFNAARVAALYDHGHSGYTGSLAEKHNFVMIKMPIMPLDASEKDARAAMQFAEGLARSTAASA
jgi:hypothetical protein